MIKRILNISLIAIFLSTSVYASSGDRFWAVTDFSKGQNSHVQPFKTPPNQGVEATNVRINDSYGALSKREATIQSLSYGTTAINGLYRYYESDGTTNTIVATSTFLRSDFSGTATTIKTGLSDGKRWQFVTYQDMVIGGNDTDLPIKYDGHTLTTDNTDAARTASELCAELGAPFAELNTGANLDASSWYQYMIIHYDGTTYSYSTARSNSIKTGAAVKDIYLTDIPIGPAGTTHRYIYRSEGQADQATVEALANTAFKLAITIADNSTLVSADTTTDGGLGAAWAATGTNATPPVCSIWEIHAERLFGSGNTTLKSQIFWSDEYNPDYFDPIDVEEIRPDDGDKVTFLKNIRGDLAIGKTNTIQNWYTNAASDANWYVSDPFSFVGCPAPYSVANTPKGLFYLSWSGLYNYNGQASALISDPITDVINDISRGDIATTAGFYHENEYHLSYTSDSSGSTYNDKELIYDLIRDAYVIDTKNISCYAAFNSGADTGTLYMGSSTTDGWVFKYDVGEESVIAQYKSDIDAGTFTYTASYELSNNPQISLEFLDNMEDYNDDSLAQAGWVSSDYSPSFDSSAILVLNLDDNIIDASTTPHVLTNGDVTFSSTNKVFGSHSAYFDGINDYLKVPHSADFAFGASDFTIDMRVKFTSRPVGEVAFMSQSDDSTGDDYWWFGMDDDEINFRQGESGLTTIDVFAGAWTPTLNTWYHIAVARNGSTFRFFVDGVVQTGTNTDATAMADLTDDIYIGIYENGTGNYIKDFHGYIDEVRVTKGGARWTAAFTPFNHAYGANTQSYSEASTINEGAYALKLETMKSNSSTDTYTKTISAIDLSASTHDDIAIDVYADRTYDTGPAVCTDGTGKILVTDAAHGLATDDFIIVSGTTDYNGTWKITKVNDNSFTFVDTYTSGQTGVWKYGYITLGISETAATYGDTSVIPICPTTANTWETIILDFTQLADASKNAIIEARLTVADAAHDNVVIIDNIRPAITATTVGTWESPVYNIGAESLYKLYWNEDLGAYGDITWEVRTGAADPIVPAYATDPVYTTPTGSKIEETANTYIQFKASFESADAEYTPYLYKADGFIYKFTYSSAGTNYETSVPSAWQSGWKNFDVEGYRKFIRRIKIFYEGTSGVLVCRFQGEEGDVDQSFSINLSINPDDDLEDSYTGSGDTKVYTWYAPANTEDVPSPISEWFWFTFTEAGAIVWDVNRMQVMYQLEEIY